ncbi:MAG: DNA alkylation repair protein [Verrucomicrobiales bacterium]
MNPDKKTTAEKRATGSARSAKGKIPSASARSPSDKAAAKKSDKTPPPRLTFAEAMRELEKAGSAQTRKTYARHGAPEPMFGVSFATLKALTKRIGVDHELALELWDTGNFDAQNLAVKIVDPARMTPDDLDRWIRGSSWALMCGSYAAMLPAEGPHAAQKSVQWLSSRDQRERTAGWTLLGQLAMRDVTSPDALFKQRLAEIERTIHSAPNLEREIMNRTVIAIGCRNNALRKAALAAAKRIGNVEVDHGDTACKTPDAAAYIEKTWAHAKAKGFESPAAQERKREVPRRRC